TDRDRQILKLVLARQQMGWPFLAPPDVPADRVQVLRQAFDATMKDAEYLAEVKQRRLDINPMTGAQIDKLVGELYQTPPDVIATTKSVIADGARSRRTGLTPSFVPVGTRSLDIARRPARQILSSAGCRGKPYVYGV